jgi:hypothetical protein
VNIWGTKLAVALVCSFSKPHNLVPSKHPLLSLTHIQRPKLLQTSTFSHSLIFNSSAPPDQTSAPNPPHIIFGSTIASAPHFTREARLSEYRIDSRLESTPHSTPLQSTPTPRLSRRQRGGRTREIIEETDASDNTPRLLLSPPRCSSPEKPWQPP